MENNKNIGWYLDIDYVYVAFSFSMDTMLVLSCCLFVYLNVALQLPLRRDACITISTLT